MPTTFKNGTVLLCVYMTQEMFIGKYRRCSKVLHLLRTFPKKVDHAFLLNRVQETAARAVDGRGGPFAGRLDLPCLASPKHVGRLQTVESGWM